MLTVAVLLCASLAAVRAVRSIRRPEHRPRALELVVALPPPPPKCGTQTTSCAYWSSGMVPVGHSCDCVAVPGATTDPKACMIRGPVRLPLPGPGMKMLG